MGTNYVKIFSGNTFLAKRIVGRLHEMGIVAITKDESESGRMAGFPSTTQGDIDVSVHKDEEKEALRVVGEILDGVD